MKTGIKDKIVRVLKETAGVRVHVGGLGVFARLHLLCYDPVLQYWHYVSAEVYAMDTGVTLSLLQDDVLPRHSFFYSVRLQVRRAFSLKLTNMERNRSAPTPSGGKFVHVPILQINAFGKSRTIELDHDLLAQIKTLVSKYTGKEN